MLRLAAVVALFALVQASLYGESNLNHTCQLRPSLLCCNTLLQI